MCIAELAYTPICIGKADGLSLLYKMQSTIFRTAFSRSAPNPGRKLNVDGWLGYRVRLKDTQKVRLRFSSKSRVVGRRFVSKCQADPIQKPSFASSKKGNFHPRTSAPTRIHDTLRNFPLASPQKRPSPLDHTSATTEHVTLFQIGCHGQAAGAQLRVLEHFHPDARPTARKLFLIFPRLQQILDTSFTL